MEIRKLDVRDYNNVLAFYKTQIELLERKDFFYPYQDSDIKNILNNGGIMLGAFDSGKLIGLSAVDFDQSYSEILKNLVNTFYTFADEKTQVCEYSGVMTDINYRKKGIAARLYEQLISNIKKPICLCAVVQLENQASLTFFFNRGFRLVFTRRDYQIDFGYLIKFCDKHIDISDDSSHIIDCLDYNAYYELFKQGYVGTQFDDNKIKMCKAVISSN